MKFSESWLREWIDPAVSTAELVEQLTMAGLEVDAVEPVAPEFSGVVVGEIVAIAPHPDADKLRVCQVAGGPEPVQVVCGAPNARVGIKVPFAMVGAKLPGDFKIKKAKLRGVESFGMLCAAEELGMADNSDGLWEFPVDAPVGTDLYEYLLLNDRIIEVDLTPNRGDCLSVRGIAREVAVLNQLAVTDQPGEAIEAVIEDVIEVNIVAPQACPRYVGRVIRNIDPTAQTPLWLQEKLRRSGLRPIDPVVDVTNYVLLELGQPMHAFDLDTLQGGVEVRMSRAEEKIALLDGSEVELDDNTLVIADQQRAIAMAGIMGGAATAVSEKTTNIFLESAYFDLLAIAGKARGYGMHTDSSHRFERGVDPQLQVRAIERATELLLAIVGGEPGPVVCRESQEHLPGTAEIPLRLVKLTQQLGVAIAAEQVAQILTHLGIEIIDQQADEWLVKSPSWRFDIAIEADLVEEIARIYGYNNIPTTVINGGLSINPRPEGELDISAIRGQLLARGFQEVITYSFVDVDLQQLITPDLESVIVANPIASDMSVMRTSLWPGLLTMLRSNLNRQQSRVRAFEVGQVFIPGDKELLQENRIAGIICGAAGPENWTGVNAKVDFFDIKGALEALLALTGETFRFAAADHPALQPGQSAQVEKDGVVIGWVGKLHPALVKQLSLSQEAFVFELQLAAIQRSVVPSCEDVSKFPEVRRDLAFIVDGEVTYEQLSAVVRAAAGKSLTDLKVFDVYQGKGIENNRKSVALGLTFQETSRTLTETEINEAASCVVDALEKQFSASLRG